VSQHGRLAVRGMYVPVLTPESGGGPPALLSEPAAADRRGIGFGWLQNAWLLHARLKILTGGLTPGSEEPTQKTRGPVH
jgi:hypothetical protein